MLGDDLEDLSNAAYLALCKFIFVNPDKLIDFFEYANRHGVRTHYVGDYGKDTDPMD